MQRIESKHNGFTLLEMVLSLVILAIVAGIVAPLISNGLTASVSTQSGFSSLSTSNMSMHRLLRELRQIEFQSGQYNCDIILSSDLRCIKSDANNTQFRINTSGQQLVLSYSIPAVSATLLDSVSNLQFRYLDRNGAITADLTELRQIEVLLGVFEPASGAELQLRSRVTLRNRG